MKKSLELKINHGFARAKKALGQNFLKSSLALKKIVGAGKISKEDIILEIGPGKGALTEKLLSAFDSSRKNSDKEEFDSAGVKGGYVIAIEKDKILFEMLKEKFSTKIKLGSLVLVHDDILNFDASAYGLEPRAYKVIANIPYNITGVILKKFLTNQYQPTRMVLMVQHEVAKRILAKDNKESILSISVKAYGEPEMIMKVPARYFSPQPKVDSAVIAINNISRERFSASSARPCLAEFGQVNEEKFWQIIHAGFAHKRKKLAGNLKSMLKDKKELLLIYGNKRAEDLSLSDWISLART